MKKATAKNDTHLIKDLTKSPHVPQGKILHVEEILERRDGHTKVRLAYGAGDWWICNSDFVNPGGDSKLQSLAQNSTKTQVVEALCEQCRMMGVTNKDHVAYVLATAEWESRFKPVREGFNASNEWRRKNLRYYPYYGRGFVQLTWEDNYRKYGVLLGIDLVNQPDKALDINIALFVIVHGMSTGGFTGKKLSDFPRGDYWNMRKIVNPGEVTYKSLHHKNQNFVNAARKWENYLTKFESKYDWLV